MSTARPSTAAAVIALACIPAAAPTAAAADTGSTAPIEPGEPPRTYLRLVDDLDRPDDGYCLDVLGSGDAVRLDMPLTAHNCKPGYYADEGVTLADDGTLLFPAYGGCVTAMGVNASALPGASLMLKRCGERTPFLEAPMMQGFVHEADGRVRLAGSALCLEAGADSAPTFDPTHRWRTLALADCEDGDPARSRWRFEERVR